MGRPRSTKWYWLPTGYYHHHGRIVKRIYEEGRWLKDEYVCPATWPRSKIYEKIEQHSSADHNTLKWLLLAYLGSPQYKEKSFATQVEYRRFAKNFINEPLKGNKRLGDIDLIKITPQFIRHYLDKKESKISANRHIQFLKAVFNWGRERYAHIKDNPCLGVKLNKQSPRTRYIQDWEFELVRDISTSPYIPIFMEFAYLCRARFSEVADFKRSDIIEQGILLRRKKGSKDEITLWSPRLESVVEKAKNLNRTRFSHFLIHDKDGLPIKYGAFSSAWRRTMDKAFKNGLKESFTFHDIKAKGVSDHEDKASGHRSMRMLDVYDRKTDEIKSTR